MADFSISAFITANTKGFKAGLDDAQKSLSNFGSSLKKTLLAVGSFTVSLKAVSSVTKFAKEATSEFAKANSAIIKGTGATGSAFANLSKSVQTAMKNGVGRSASEIGEMVADLNTRFGATGKELEKLVDEFDKFSSVTGVDTKQSIESLADVMAKWNISTEESNSLMDQLVYASQASGLSVTELTGALKSGQTTFDAFGMSVTESIGFLGQLKTQGVDTNAALSALKIGMAKFASSGGDVSKQFNLVAKRIQNAKTESEALQIAVNNFGAKGGAELVKVFKNNGLNDFISQLENAKGTLARTEEASRTSADALEDLKAQIQATFFSGETDSYLKQIIDEIKIGFTEIDSDTMYDIFNDIYKAVQICVNSIDAIIHGDWETVWDYAKLVVLKLVNSVSEALQKMVDDLGLKVNVAAGIIGGLATGFGILTGNVAVAAAGVGVAVGSILATNKTLMAKVGEETQEEIDELEKTIIARTNKNAEAGGEQLLKDLKRTQADIKTQTEKTGELIENSAVPNEKTIKKRLDGFTKGVKKGLESIIGEYKDLEDFSDIFNKLLENTGAIITNQVAGSFKTFFTQLGEELVNGGLSWQSMTSVILQSISETLSALGSELTALAAVSLVTEQYHKAAIAAAGAAAAFTASGVVAGIANKMKDVTKATSAANMSLKQFYKNLEELSNVSSLDEYASSLGKIKKQYTEISDALQNTSDMIKGVEVARKISAAQFAAENYKYDWYRKENYANLDYSSYYEFTIQGKLNKAYKESLKLLDDLSESERAVAEYWIEHNSRLNKSGSNLKDYYKSLVKLGQQYIQELTAIQDKLNTFDADTIATLKAQQEELEYSAFMYDYIFSQVSSWGEGIDFKSQYSVLYNQLLVNIKNVGLNLKKELLNIGTSVGDSLIDGIIDGAEKTDFLSSLKSIVRENVLKLAVYTDSMQEELANASAELISAISMGDSVLLSRARTNFESIWDSAKQAATDAENFINEVFGDIQDGIEDVTNEIKEMGSSIADSLIDGLSNGLSQADFLETMKSYIKKLVVTSVVYTESLQAEISAIGEAISNGIKEGFSETGLEEIRRDLSYIWYNANNAVSAIDSVLNNVFTGYATGTDNATAGLHLVGEAGPELVRFRGGEQVYNANDTRNMLQSGNVGGNNFNVTFNNMQDTSAFTMLQQMKQWQRDMAINGVI